MRVTCMAAAALLITLGSGPALGQDDNAGGAYGQLQNATSGNQTLSQTYGDDGHGESCPEACPSGTGEPPEPPPPQPDTSDGG